VSGWLLNISKEGDSTTFPGNLLQHFTESQNHRIVGVGRDLCGSSSPKEVFPDVQTEPPVFQFVPIASSLPHQKLSRPGLVLAFEL